MAVVFLCVCQLPAGDTVIGALDGTDPTYSRVWSGVVDLNCNAPSSPRAGSFHYDVIPIFATTPQVLTAEVVQGGTTIGDTVISLHCDFDPILPAENLVAYDDDGGQGLMSAFTDSDNLSLDPNQLYFLVLSTYSAGQMGNYQIDLGGDYRAGYAFASAEDCASVTTFISTSFAVTDETTGATDDLDIDSPTAMCTAGFPWIGTGQGPDVVYGFMTPFGGDVAVTMDPLDVGGAADDLALYVVTDCADLEGSCVAENDSGGTGAVEGVVFTADPEVEYFIIVDGYGGAAGPYHLDVDFTPVAADLAITKTNGLTEVSPGEPVTYTIVATNGGPNDALNIPITDSLTGFPLTNTMWMAQATPGSTVTPVTGTGEVHVVADVLTGGAVTIELATQVGDFPWFTVTNVARVGSTGNDPVPANNEATDTDDVRLPDLVLTQTADSNFALPGQVLQLSLTLSNSGSFEARNARVTGELEPGLEALETTCGGSVSPDRWVWDAGTLQPGETISCEVTVAATYPICTVFRSQATAVNDLLDQSFADNTARFDANLPLNIMLDPSFELGPTATRWNGRSELFSPSAPFLQSGLARTGTWGLHFVETASAEQTVGPIPPSSEVWLKFHLYQLISGASPEDVISVFIDNTEISTINNDDPGRWPFTYGSQTIDISAFGDDASHELRFVSRFNNFPYSTWYILDDVYVTVCPEFTDLTLTKTDSPDPAVAGQALSYTLDLFNDGPGGSLDAVLLDTLPPEVSVLDVLPPGLPWQVNAGVLSIEVGSVPPIQEELIVNGSFETGDLTGWTVLVAGPVTAEFLAAGVYPAGTSAWFAFPGSQPVDGAFSYMNGFDASGPFTYDTHQEITIPVDAVSATLRWADELHWDTTFGATITREYEVRVEPAGGGVPIATLFSQVAPPLTFVAGPGEAFHAVDLLTVGVNAGDTVRLNWHETIPETFTGPAQFELDDVSVVAVRHVPAVTVVVETEVDPSLVSATLVNTASVTTSTLDLDSANNTAMASTEVVAPVVTATPASLDFGRLDIDDDPPLVMGLTIGNAGTAPLMFTGAEVTVTGPGSAELAISADSGQAILSPGANRVLAIEFDPVTLGDKTSILIITCDDPDDPVIEVPLIAEGAQLGPTGHTTGEIVAYLLGLITGPPAEFDVNTDTTVDAADVVENVEAINSP